MRSNQEREKFWGRHVEAWRESGLTQVQYSARHGISHASLSYWSWRSRKKAGEKKARGSKAAALNLVAVQLGPKALNHGCVVRGPHGWTVEFSSSPPAQYLAEVLGGLR